MKQHLLFLAIILTPFLSKSQTNTEEALLSVETQEQAKDFVENKYAFESKIFTFNEEKHKTQLAKALFKLQKSQVKSVETEREKTLYKILEKTSKTYYRVAYIVLDGSTYSYQSIQNLREKLIEKHKNGTPFSVLAHQYSMDDNAKKGGDTGWFTIGDLSASFEEAIITESRGLEDIYTIDLAPEQLYYLVLQTHESKDISEIKVLKIVEPIE
ncbi:peptidylprolyl isomerase [Hyunsoonleella sp. SJ7]|uniref:Peptidylprolyl isomerase n=1 Tax=Hyunsoonleella aquatilis TaxID=2762758 RepID=A0A923H916_9FLAO|nr:peptidylprolyl isomerase [Hyunsoonleella aquatilis]MBC3758613.1 peptidylprolyl isomerase [Hyunsoonleella aquatilis]